MQLQIGNYFFVANACDIRGSIDTVKNRGGQPLSTRQRLDVVGYLQTAGQADCTAQMNTLYTALTTPYLDIVLNQDSGAQSATRLLNAGSISGVIVTRGPNFPANTGGEYTNYRKFEFSAEAEYPLPGTVALLMSFTERLVFGGGGPLRTIMLGVNGINQVQTIYPATPYTLLQVGEAVGYRLYPTPPPPRYPDALMESPNTVDTTPDRMGKGYQGYKISWEYKMKSLKPMPALPNLWL